MEAAEAVEAFHAAEAAFDEYDDDEYNEYSELESAAPPAPFAPTDDDQKKKAEFICRLMLRDAAAEAELGPTIDDRVSFCKVMQVESPTKTRWKICEKVAESEAVQDATNRHCAYDIRNWFNIEHGRLFIQTLELDKVRANLNLAATQPAAHRCRRKPSSATGPIEPRRALRLGSAASGETPLEEQDIQALQTIQIKYEVDEGALSLAAASAWAAMEFDASYIADLRWLGWVGTVAVIERRKRGGSVEWELEPDSRTARRERSREGFSPSRAAARVAGVSFLNMQAPLAVEYRRQQNKLYPESPWQLNSAEPAIGSTTTFDLTLVNPFTWVEPPSPPPAEQPPSPVRSVRVVTSTSVCRVPRQLPSPCPITPLACLASLGAAPEA